MIRFNDYSILVGYLKSVLHDFNLPTIKVWEQDTKIFKDQIYLYKNKILKALVTKDSSNISDLEESGNTYSFGERLLNITKNFEIRNLIYDSYTHEYLGEYLRFIKKYQGLNLMSMYNCFNNNLVKDLELEIPLSDGMKVKIDSKDDDYILYAIPVKPFEKYTVAIESKTSIEIFGAIITSEGLSIESGINNLIKNSYVKISSPKFTQPFVYDKLTHKNLFTEDHINKESRLRLIVRIPRSTNSSIVILEGDYSKNNKQYFEDGEAKNIVQIITSERVEKKDIQTLGRLQLLNINDGISYPFADRLIEVIFGNMITKQDGYIDNIKHIQDILSRKFGVDITKEYGEWTENMRAILYDIQQSDPQLSKFLDLTGNIDKDTEKFIRG